MSSLNAIESLRAVNRTGAPFTGPCLVSFSGGWFSAGSQVQAVLAQANGTGKVAQGLCLRTVADRGGVNALTVHLLEGTAAKPVNTLAALVPGAPVYLSPAAPGGWTFTKPASGQDVQVVGIVVVVHATLGKILFNLQQGPGICVPAGFVSPSMMTVLPLHDEGVAGSGWIRFSGPVLDGERVTINGRVYEFDTTAPPGSIAVGADVRVGVSGGEGGAGAVNATAQLIAALNADVSAVIHAAPSTATDEALFVSKARGIGGNYAISTTSLVGSLSGAAMKGGIAANSQKRGALSYTVTAGDVTVLATTLGSSEIPIGVFPVTSAPSIVNVSAFRPNGATGYDPIALAGAHFFVRQASTGYYVVSYAEPAGGALLLAADLIKVDVALAD